jgi:error-prone DNA polymerase
MTPELLELAHGHDIGDSALVRADEGKTGPHGSDRRGQDRNAELERRRSHNALPSGRNFH